MIRLIERFGRPLEGGGWPFLIFYVMLICALTLSPFEFSMSYSHEKLGAIRKLGFQSFFLHFKPGDLIANIFLFVPFGAAMKRLFSRESASTVLIILTGFLFSLSIETAQFFMQRATSLSDLIANTFGTAAGCGLALSRIWMPGKRRMQIYRSLPFRIFAPLFCATAAVVLLVKPVLLNDASDWDESFVLTLGNETTGDRPWFGEMHGVALYNRALRDNDVLRLSVEGWEQDGIVFRKSLGANAVIPFFEKAGDTVRACDRPDVVLVARGPFSWGHPSGVVLKGGCFSGANPMAGWTAGVKKNPQFSVEAVIRTSSLNQKGPARIATLSRGNDRRNFTLAQEGTGIVFRVRTPAAGPNGSIVSARTVDGLTDGMHHLMATWNRGVSHIWIDGVLQGGHVGITDTHAPMMTGLGRNRVSRMAFGFFFLLPFAFSLYPVFKRKAFGCTVFFSLFFLLAVQWILYLGLGQPGDFIFLIAGTLAALGGAGAGWSVGSARTRHRLPPVLSNQRGIV